MICVEKLYFTIVFVKTIKYYCFSYTYILITLILLPVILEGEWQVKFLTLLKFGYQNKIKEWNFDIIPRNEEEIKRREEL